MKNKIAITITSGLIVGFFAGSISMIAILLYFDAQESHYYEDGRPRMNCFAGLGYAFAIGIHILMLLANSPAYLNVFKKIRENQFLLYLTFFGGSILYLILLLLSLSELSVKEFLVLFPWINIVVWVYYFIKVKKLIHFVDNQI